MRLRGVHVPCPSPLAAPSRAGLRRWQHAAPPATKAARRQLLGQRVAVHVEWLDVDNGVSVGRVVGLLGDSACRDPSLPDPTGMRAVVPYGPVGTTVECRVVSAPRKPAGVKVALLPQPAPPAALPPTAAAPQCAHYGSCGGCAFQSTSYAVQYAAKLAWVEAQLRDALGRDSWEALVAARAREHPGRPLLDPGRPARSVYRYRNRVAFSLGSAEWLPAGSGGGGGAGGRRGAVLGFNPTRHAGAGAARDGSGALPSGSTNCGEAPAEAPPPAAAASVDDGGGSGGGGSDGRGRGMGGLWTKRVVITDCALMAAGHQRILAALHDALAAWDASPACAALPPLHEALEEACVRAGDAPVGGSGGAPVARLHGGGGDTGDLAAQPPAFQLMLRWAEAAHMHAFRAPFVEGVLLPRLAPLLASGWGAPGTAGSAAAPPPPLPSPPGGPGRLVSVVGVSFPTSVPRALRKEWEAEEAARAGPDAPPGTVAAAVQAAAVRHLAGVSTVYAGSERLAKSYRLAGGAGGAPAAQQQQLLQQGRQGRGQVALTLHVSPRAFVQPSDEGCVAIMEALGDVVAEAAAADAGAGAPPAAAPPRPLVAWDLFCGTGALGLSLAVRGLVGRLVGLELDAAAVRDAAANAAANGLGGGGVASFHAVNLDGGVGGLLARQQQLPGGDGALPPPDVVVVDPPRAGLHHALVEELRGSPTLRPRWVAYVSCNPATQARDIAALCAPLPQPGGGAAPGAPGARYALERVIPVDQYPHTPHVECVALLRRVEG